MKLFYSQNSPFARVARVAARESGLLSTIDEIAVINRTPDNPLLAHSPVCRVPTLVDGSLVLGEARHICAYFDHLTGRRHFLDRTNSEWGSLGFESMAFGFADAMAVWVRENRRAENQRSAFILQVEAERAGRCLDYLENRTDDPLMRPPDFCALVIGCALDVMIFHELHDDWAVGHPKLSAWFADIRQRPTMRATVPC